MRPVHEPIVLPRGLIFLASLWLMGSWMIAIGIHAPIQPSSAAYTPGVRLMLLCVTTGLMIGWPLLRLSQGPSLNAYDRPVKARPIQQTLLDLLVLLGLVQVVVWPLRLVTNWSPLRTAAIDATIAGWVLLAGAAIATALSARRNRPRNLAMLACIGMCLLGPVVAWLGVISGVDAAQLVGLSPLMAVRTLSEAGGAPPTTVQWGWIILLGTADGLAWAAVVIALRHFDRDSGQPEPNDAREA